MVDSWVMSSSGVTCVIQWHAVSCNEHAVFCEFRAHGLLKTTHVRCWNLHIQCECSAHGLLKFKRIPYGKNWNLHIAWLFRWIWGWIWTQNVGCHCIIVIKHRLLCFVTLMHGWACIDYGPQLASEQLDGPLWMHALPYINFHKTKATHVQLL